jgi:uncharacterized protein YndB with AHSA1/START domain
MSFTAKVQRSIQAPISKVWEGLTLPELVKQYFFGSNLVTTWKPGSPIYFRGEWEGKPYEDKGTVLTFEPGKVLEYDYFSSWSDLEDRPENYQIIRYRLTPKGNGTLLTITQRNIDTLEKKLHSAQNWAVLLTDLKKMMEQKEG